MKLLKEIYNKVNYKYDELTSVKPYIKLDYVSKRNNFGDILNPIIVRNMIGDNYDIHRITSNYYHDVNLMAIGSILQRANNNTFVWGSGFIAKEVKLQAEPKKVMAVRGPKTREKLIKMNIECPEVYGDPALLISKYYKPKEEKKYKLGIIPHYVDKKITWLNEISTNDDVLLIDVQNPNPLNVIKQMHKCEVIASSSLHGLIVSDSYNIPNVWIQLSNRVSGGNFKYRDYFLTTSRKKFEPLIVDNSTTYNKIIDYSGSYEIEIDLKLLEVSFPDIDSIVNL